MTQTQSTKKFFEQTYDKQLTAEETLEYKEHLVKFFSLLIEIDQRNKRKSKVNKND
jgi:hypothetical protein